MSVFLWIGLLVVAVTGAILLTWAVQSRRWRTNVPLRHDPTAADPPPATLLTTGEASRLWLRRGRLSEPPRLQ
jgi:hypothetical protein